MELDSDSSSVLFWLCFGWCGIRFRLLLYTTHMAISVSVSVSVQYDDGSVSPQY